MGYIYSSPFGPFYRTYTGHEDLWMFGLLNANARLYSPYLGRFVSPDPLLNCEGGAWDYNPYVYANNNPYKYIDRNGEFCGLVACLLDFAFNALFNAAVEATVYSVTAAISGNWNVGDFFKSMGMAAVSSALQVGGIVFGAGNNFAMNIMSNMVNKNVMSEVGINTFRGAVTGFSSGVVNAIVHDDPSLVLKGAAGGAQLVVAQELQCIMSYLVQGINHKTKTATLFPMVLMVSIEGAVLQVLLREED